MSVKSTANRSLLVESLSVAEFHFIQSNSHQVNLLCLCVLMSMRVGGRPGLWRAWCTGKRKRYQVPQSSQTCNINSNIFNSMHFCGCCQSSAANALNIPEICTNQHLWSILFS